MPPHLAVNFCVLLFFRSIYFQKKNCCCNNFPHFSSFPLWYSCLPQTLCLFWGVHNFFKMTVLHLLSVRTKNRWWVRHRPPSLLQTHRTGGFPGLLLGVAFKVLLAHLSLHCGHCLLPLGTYTCFACIYVYMSVIYMPGAYRGQKRLSDLQEQVLQMVVNHQVCAGNQDLWKNSQCS